MIVAGLLVTFFVVTTLSPGGPSKQELPYNGFLSAVKADKVKSVKFDKDNGKITGDFKTPQHGKTEFTSSGPKDDLPASTLSSWCRSRVSTSTTPSGARTSSPSYAPILIPVLLIIGFFVWMSRRAQGQMGAVMNIGAQPGEGLQHREAEDDVRRRRRLRRR